MAVWNLFRYRNSDGSSKDWAVTTNADGSISTRWGKTASRLPSINTRTGIRQYDIERQKQAKGYVFVGEVEIDADGNIRLPRSAPMADPSPMPLQTIAVDKLYWHVDCRAGRNTLLELGIALRRWLGDLKAWSQARGDAASDWSGWQRLSDASLGDEAFDLSGQIDLEHGVLP